MEGKEAGAVMVAAVCCVLVALLLPEGIAYIVVASNNGVAECALPAYLMWVSPVSWLYWVGASYLITLGLLGACSLFLVCSPAASVVLFSLSLWGVRLWKIASVFVTGFVLFRQFNAVCYGTPVWQALLSEFIISILGFCVSFTPKSNTPEVSISV
jgi:hypothetical protein